MTFVRFFFNQFLLLPKLFEIGKLIGLVIVVHNIYSFADNYVLKSVLIPDAPRINKEKNVFYKLDLIFDKCPPDYWINYSEKKEKLIIDFYGINIIGKPEVSLSERGVFKKIDIENSETKLSLSGKGSKILINIEVDHSWHFKATSINNTTIRINVWKDVSDLSIVEQNKKPVRFYIILGSVLFILPLGVILFLFI